MFDNLVIVASGLGTRMAEYTFNNKVPKVLLSLGHGTILDAQLKDKVANKVYVIANAAHVNMLNDIKKLRGYEFEILECNTQHGTAHTIMSTLKDTDISGNTLFVWSDIVAESTESLKPILVACEDYDDLTATLILDKNRNHRLDYDNGQLIYDEFSNGRLCGSYVISNIQEFLKYADDYSHKYNSSYDLVELLVDMQNDANLSIVTSLVDNFIDVGDSTKYKHVVGDKIVKQRYFNSIDMRNPNFVIKSSYTEMGQKLIKREIDAYRQFAQIAPDTIPQVWTSVNNDSIILEKLAKDVSEMFSTMEDCRINFDMVFADFDLLQKRMMSIPIDVENVEQVVSNAAKIEYYDTLITRYESGKSLYDVAEQVAGVSFSELVSKIKKFVESHKVKPSYMHGDTNTSNLMYDADYNLKFIDIRGYFGDVTQIGDIAYDYAKFVFGAMGWSRMVHAVHCPTYKFDEEYQQMEDFIDGLDCVDVDVKIIAGLIWLKAPVYYLESPAKAIFFGAIGLKLLYKYLK